MSAARERCCLKRFATSFLSVAVAAGALCPATRAFAWNDAPLCVAQRPEHELYSQYESEADLSCKPETTFALQQGPLWTAPISGDEARRALQDSDQLAAVAPADALLKLRLVERGMPRIADRLAMRRAELLLQLDRASEACDAFRTAAESPETNVAAQARIGLARCLLQADQHQGEVELDKLCKRYPRLEERFALQLLQARARESWKNQQGAVALYRNLDLFAPESRSASEARDALARLRDSGVHVQPFTPVEWVERTERLVERGSIEAGRNASSDLLEVSSLSPQLKGRAYLLAARVARIEGRWETVRAYVAKAQSCGLPAGECQRYLPRGNAGNEALDPEVGEQKVKRLLAGRSMHRLKPPQLRGVLDVAVQYGLTLIASDVLDAMSSGGVHNNVPPQVRFEAGIVASGVADDAAIARLFEGLRDQHAYHLAASYYHARSLERIGQTDAARAEYLRVIEEDQGVNRYYGTWAQARLSGFEQLAAGSCQRDATGACVPDVGLQRAAAGPADGSPNTLAALDPSTGSENSTQRLDSELELQPSFMPSASDKKRETIVTRLGALAAIYDKAYPWFGRAADLAELELYDDAAAEVGEAYLAYHDARGGYRLRAGVEAVLTNTPPPRHAAPGNVRRDRLALDDNARFALADVADLLDEPGIALRLRDQRGEILPRAYEQDVQRAANKYGVDPNLLFAVMRVESVYYRHIVSFAGAIGLMQIMPRTGMRIARALGVTQYDTLDLLDPRKNLEFAAWYLASLITRFDGRVPLAVAAYNGGPHNVRLWVSAHPANMPLDAFLERIPFVETHHYVRRVLTSYAAYRAQQNLPMPNLADTLPKLEPDSIAF
jgi:hypothetical protein